MKKDHQVITISIILIVTSIILAECTNSPPNLIATSAESIKRSTSPTKSPVLLSLETMITNPDYMRGCLQINPVRLQEQVSFKNIYPGVTPPEDIERLVGKPVEVGDNRTNSPNESVIYDAYIYENYSIHVDILTRKISEIYVQEMDKGMEFPPLSEIIQQYGCPDVIYAKDMTMEKHGWYSATEFQYFKEEGISFFFNTYPLKMDSRPKFMFLYFPSIKHLADYYSVQPPTYAYTNYILPIYWDQALFKRYQFGLPVP